MEKKCIILLLVIIFAFAFGGCGNKQEPEAENRIATVENPGIAGAQKEQEAAGLLFEIPESFAEDEDLPGLYLSGDYQRDLACIFYQEHDAQARQELLTEDNIAPLMQEMYTELYGIEVTVEMIDFHKLRLDGHPGCRIETEITTDEAVLQNIEYVIYTDEKSYSLTYRQRKNVGWAETFAQSADQLKVRK